MEIERGIGKPEAETLSQKMTAIRDELALIDIELKTLGETSLGANSERTQKLKERKKELWDEFSKNDTLESIELTKEGESKTNEQDKDYQIAA